MTRQTSRRRLARWRRPTLVPARPALRCSPEVAIGSFPRPPRFLAHGAATLVGCCLIACAAASPPAPRPAFLQSPTYAEFKRDAVAYTRAPISLSGAEDSAPAFLYAVASVEAGEGVRLRLFGPVPGKSAYQQLCRTTVHQGAEVLFLTTFATAPLPSFGWTADYSTPERRRMKFEVLSVPTGEMNGQAPCSVVLTYEVGGPTDEDSALPSEAWGGVRQLESGAVEVVRAERRIELASASGRMSVPTMHRLSLITLAGSQTAGRSSRRLHVEETLRPIFRRVKVEAALAFDAAAQGGVEPWPQGTTLVLRAGHSTELKLVARARDVRGSSGAMGQGRAFQGQPRIVALEWLLGCDLDADSLQVERPPSAADEARTVQRFNAPMLFGGLAAAVGVARPRQLDASWAGMDQLESRQLWLLREALTHQTLVLRDTRPRSSQSAPTTMSDGLCVKGVQAWVWTPRSAPPASTSTGWKNRDGRQQGGPGHFAQGLAKQFHRPPELYCPPAVLGIETGG